MNFPNNTAGQPARIEGLIVAVRDYRENDAIADVLCGDEVVSVCARGVQKEASKNRRLIAPYSKVSLNYEPKYSGSMLYLINGSTIQSYYRCADSLESQCVCEIAASLIRRHAPFEHGQQLLEACWSAWQQNNPGRAMLYACSIVVQALRQTGVLMNVDECGICGSTARIAGLSSEAGGFVCLDHLDSLRPLPRVRLMQLRRIVKAPVDKLPLIEDYPWDVSFFILLLEWYVFFNDTRLKSMEFLKTMSEDLESFAITPPAQS